MLLTPPQHFGTVEKGVYRSDMLRPSHFTFIKSLRLKTILVLSPEVTTRAVTNFLEENNIRLVGFVCNSFPDKVLHLYKCMQVIGTFRPEGLEAQYRLATGE